MLLNFVFENFFFLERPLDIAINSLIPRTILSTIVISAVCAVLDSGFRSKVITFFPIFLSAIVRSPSSSGTNTTSAE